MRVLMINQKVYNETYFKNRKFENKYYWLAVQWACHLQPKNVFDYGCGEGFLVHAFNYVNIPCIGYDISEYAIDNAYELAKGMINIKYDASKKYDLVVCSDVLEHVKPEDEQQVIDDICALSNKDIILSICDTLLINRYVDPTHINIRPRAYWEHQFEKRGWKKLKTPNNWIVKEQLYLFTKGDD